MKLASQRPPPARRTSPLAIAAAGRGAIALAAALVARPTAPAAAAPTSACPISTLPPAAACAPAPTGPLPGMPHNGMPHNGLSAAALAGNAQLLAHLVANPLTPGMFVSDPILGALVAKPDAADLVGYIVSCALDPCDVVAVPPALQGQFPHGFAGELGLCGARFAASPAAAVPPEPTWSQGAATDGCRERVSACVLARVNQLGKRVVVSLRGDGVGLAPRVPVETALREHHGTPIVSFTGCDVACLAQDPVRRNCDWQPRFVGRCLRGPDQATTPNQVALALALPPGVHGRIRICAGIHGCDDFAPGGGPTTGATVPPYSGGLIAQGVDQVVFACPRNGPRLQTSSTLDRTGYYSVMVGAVPGSSLPPGVDVVLAPASDGSTSPFDVYPAPETQVFTYREGAFFGDLFAGLGDEPRDEPRDLKATPSAELMFSGDQHACYSDLWDHGAAMASDRYCAGPTGCFANPPDRCDPDLDVAPAVPGVGLVATPAVLGEEVYDACHAPTRWWHAPYTTYLNHPCDLFPSPTACIAHLDPDVAASL